MIDDPEKTALRRSERAHPSPAVMGLSLLAAMLLAVASAPGSSQAMPTPRHQALLDIKDGSASLVRRSFPGCRGAIGKGAKYRARSTISKRPTRSRIAAWRGGG